MPKPWYKPEEGENLNLNPQNQVSKSKPTQPPQIVFRYSVPEKINNSPPSPGFIRATSTPLS